MPDKTKGEEPFEDYSLEGYSTNLGSKDEFRCLIAALYGQDFGRATASDIALRCAFYGNAKLTKKDMKAGSKRDWSAYRFAVVYSFSLPALPEFLFHLGGDDADYPCVGRNLRTSYGLWRSSTSEGRQGRARAAGTSRGQRDGNSGG
jgi:hypothetical protein